LTLSSSRFNLERMSLELPADIRAFLERARAERPQCTGVTDDQLVSQLSRAANPDLAKLHAGDLLLALACAQRHPPSLAAFERELLGTHRLAAALARIDPSPAFLDEVRQTVRERILVARPGETPRIAEYSGRGSLQSWTQVIALRCALDLRPARAEQAPDEIPEQAGEADPELRMLRDRYGKAFEAALTQAFSRLDDEQTNLLRLQIVDGLQTARIAALFHVDRSTIKRKLAECREALLTETRALLGAQLGASPDSLESILRLVRSQLHVSVARLLREK
jgi:RNA polymerase sigma-70 factor (ECF subfamily)